MNTYQARPYESSALTLFVWVCMQQIRFVRNFCEAQRFCVGWEKRKPLETALKSHTILCDSDTFRTIFGELSEIHHTNTPTASFIYCNLNFEGIILSSFSKLSFAHGIPNALEKWNEVVV